MSNQKIGVVGGGLMGHGIAYLLAAAGHTVARLRAVGGVRAIAAAAAAGRSCDLLGDDPALLDRITAHDQLAPAVQGRSLRVRGRAREAAAQAADLRRARKPDRARHHPRQQQLGHPVDRDRPQPQASRARGRHAFLEPAASRAAGRGDPERVDQRRRRCARTIELLRDAGRKPVHVRRDIPGFIGNRLQHASKREAIALVAAGVCDAETIDTVVKERLRRPHGGARPDGAVRSGRPRPHARHRERCCSPISTAARGPHRSCSEKVKAGKLGMRTGEGFRTWTPSRPTRCASGCGAFSPSRRRRRSRGVEHISPESNCSPSSCAGVTRASRLGKHRAL